MRLRYGENFAGTDAGGRATARPDARRRHGDVPSGRPRARLGADRGRMQRHARSSPRATTRTSPTRPARRSSWCRATSSSPRRPSACRCSATATPTREIAKLLRSVALFPERAHLVGAYSLGKAQRVIALHPRGRLRQADLPARRDGEDHALLRRAAASISANCARCSGAKKAELAGTIALCPPSALQGLLVAALPRSGHRLRVGLDAGARARAPARRRTAAGDLRSRRLGRPDRHHRRDRRLARSG